MRIDYSDFDGDRFSLGSYVLKEKAMSRFVFEDTFEQLCVGVSPLEVGCTQKDTYCHIRLHRIVSAPKCGGPLSIGKHVPALVHLTTEPNAESILTKKFRVAGACNGLRHTSGPVDNQGTFAGETEMAFGFSDERPEVGFDLLIDNLYNREGAVPTAEWAQTMAISRGKLHIPQLMDGHSRRHFCCRLTEARIAEQGMNRSFLELLSRENLCLLGSVELRRCKWSFLTVELGALSNFSVVPRPEGRCLLGLQLAVVRQEGSSKHILREFKTELREVGLPPAPIRFSECSFTQHLVLEQHHYLQVLFTVHTLGCSQLLAQKRLTLADADRREQLAVQLRPQECSRLGAVAELQVVLDWGEVAPPPRQPAQQPPSLIDIVDFRQKQDAELVEVLLLSGRATQLAESLSEVKESLIYGSGSRPELLETLLALIKVYKASAAILRLATESVMVYLVKADLGQEQQRHLYQAIEEVVAETEVADVQPNGAGLTVREIVASRDWRQLEAEVRRARLEVDSKGDPYSLRLELGLEFLFFGIKKYPLLAELTRKSLSRWLEPCEKCSGKSRQICQ